MASATPVLPVHPYTGLHALGFRKDGRPIFPIIGGDDSADAAKAAAEKAAADAKVAADAKAKAEADAKAVADAAAAADKGFPENTPLEQMTAVQQTAYWKHQARKHEDRVKALGNLTPEKLKEIQDKATKHDELELELGSTADKAAAKAAADAKTAVTNELLPEVISGKLEAAAARAGVSEADLAKAVEFVDTAKFLGADGKVDAEKVKTFVGTIAPAKGTETRRGPAATAHGSGGTQGGSSTALTGREMWEQRHKKKTA